MATHTGHAKAPEPMKHRSFMVVTFVWARRGAGWVLPLAIGIALLAGCSTQKGLFQVSAPTTRQLMDDGAREELLNAVDQSIRYYLRVPESAEYKFGEEKYSVDEMIGSMLLFRALVLTVPDEATLANALSERFTFFESVREDGPNLFTGYYEPVIPGSEKPQGNLKTPLLGRPKNMVELNLQDFDKELPSRKLVGRIEGSRLVPFYNRAEILDGNALNGKAQVLAYVDEVDLFFLQIQGSGTVEFSEGRRLKVGYESGNGHAYRSLGAEMIRKEILSREEVTMQSIRAYLAENPDKVRNLLNTNPSYVFFRELPSAAVGHIGVPLTAGRSLALDRRLFPPGALALVSTDVPKPFEPGVMVPFRRFMLVQDTGGAIRGHGRGDLFWGEGKDAEWIAGHLKNEGRLFLLVAKKKYLDRPFELAEK